MKFLVLLVALISVTLPFRVYACDSNTDVDMDGKKRKHKGPKKLNPRFKRAKELFENQLELLGDNATHKDYQSAAQASRNAAIASSDVEEKCALYKREAELRKRQIGLLIGQATHKSYRHTANAYYNTALFFSDPKKKCSLFKRAGELREKQIELLGHKVTHRDYKDAADAFHYAADASSDPHEQVILLLNAARLNSTAAYETEIVTAYKAANASSDAREKCILYKRTAELREKQLERLRHKPTHKNYQIVAEAFRNAADASSDPREQYELYKRETELRKKQLERLVDKATHQDYKDAANAYLNAARVSPDAEEKCGLFKIAEELTPFTRRKVELTDIRDIRRYFDRGYLEIDNTNCNTLLKFSEDYDFNIYTGGVFIKGWNASEGFDPLIDLLLSFTQIKKFKLRIEWEKEQDVTYLIGSSLQFYVDLEDLDVSSCHLTDTNAQDIIDSIPNPENLTSLNVHNNLFSTGAQNELRDHFKNLTRLKL